MGLVVFGHWGRPLLTFPTSGGNEWEYHDQTLVGALAEFLDAGRVKLFSLNGLSGDGFYNRHAHPFHRSWMQRQYDEYVVQEAIPFVQYQCQTPGITVDVMGASLGAYYALNTILKHPDVVKRCFALSGVYDMTRFMDGLYDDNFYFNNPVDYVPNMTDPWFLGHLASCDIHISTGRGPWETPGPSYHMSSVLAARGIRHRLDDWGEAGGHDWPFWKHQMRQYVGQLY
jgi:esterase/lipase superfamily enzyme